MEKYKPNKEECSNGVLDKARNDVVEAEQNLLSARGRVLKYGTNSDDSLKIINEFSAQVSAAKDRLGKLGVHKSKEE